MRARYHGLKFNSTDVIMHVNALTMTTETKVTTTEICRFTHELVLRQSKQQRRSHRLRPPYHTKGKWDVTQA